MVAKSVKASTIHGKRLQAATIATMDLARGSGAIGFTNDVVPEVFGYCHARLSQMEKTKPQAGRACLFWHTMSAGLAAWYPLSISCTSPEPFGGGAPRQAMRVENHVGVPLSAMNSLGGQVRMLKASSFSPPFGCQRFPNSWEGERFIVFDQARLVLLRPLIKSVRNYEAAA
jgi:hypothetical protein